MPNAKKPVDWSKGRRRDALIWQRRGMWRSDTLAKLAAWMGLRPGMTAVDVGCGLGYLGYTYWPFFGQGGAYLGIDQSANLVNDAQAQSKQWAEGGTAKFTVGSVYDLPVSDASTDWVMCQTLLMHLEEPEKALAEMIRVAKPGALISCNEPDNLSASLTRPYSSMPEYPIEEILLDYKIALVAHAGRKALGRGDHAIGNRMVDMMTQAGLVEVDVRMNDRVQYLQPPYKSELQQDSIKRIEKFFLDNDAYRERCEHDREEFLAGGGDEVEFEQALKTFNRRRQQIREQIDHGKYTSCAGYQYLMAIGYKPK